VVGKTTSWGAGAACTREIPNRIKTSSIAFIKRRNFIFLT